MDTAHGELKAGAGRAGRGLTLVIQDTALGASHGAADIQRQITRVSAINSRPQGENWALGDSRC